MKKTFTFLAIMAASMCASSCMMYDLEKAPVKFDVTGSTMAELKERTLKLADDKEKKFHDFYDYEYGRNLTRKVKLYEGAYGLMCDLIACYSELHRRHLAIHTYYYRNTYKTEDGGLTKYPNYHKMQLDSEQIMYRLVRFDPRLHDVLKPTE